VQGIVRACYRAWTHGAPLGFPGRLDLPGGSLAFSGRSLHGSVSASPAEGAVDGLVPFRRPFNRFFFQIATQTNPQLQAPFTKMTNSSFSSADLTFPPFTKCDKCDRQTLGILSVEQATVLRQCTTCKKTTRTPLPQTKKKVIYLDQFVISDIMKSLNPQVPSHEKAKGDPFWLDLFKALETARRAQLVACPSSSEHDLESILSPFYAPLKLLYNYLSWGISFEDSDMIKRRQIYASAKAWARGIDPQYDLNPEAVIEGDLHHWTEHLLVYVKGQYPTFTEDLRQERMEAATGLQSIFSEWQGQPERSFQDFYDELIGGYGQYLLESVAQWRLRYRRIEQGVEPFSLKAALPPESSSVISDLRRVFRDAGVEDKDINTNILSFLNSDALRTVPFLRISSSMYATLARKAAAGQKKPPNEGTQTDVTILSTLLPYCDAMFIDSPCASLLSDIPKEHRLPYETKIFTSKTKAQFLSYIQQIRTDAPESHIDVVRATYGDDWESPRVDLMKELE
jgi:hypothetical protein